MRNELNKIGLNKSNENDKIAIKELYKMFNKTILKLKLIKVFKKTINSSKT